jgi:hypothetical protein
MEAQDLGGLVLAATTGDHHAVLWLKEGGELEREDVLFLCTGGQGHGVGGALARGVEAYPAGVVGLAGQDNVLGGDAEVAEALLVLGAQVDVEVELLALAELTIIVLLGRGEDFEVLCVCEVDIVLNEQGQEIWS